jgi:hypothetical protein
MLRNISSLVNVRWYLGIPFNDTSNFRLGIAEQGQQILGDYLIGLQVGNEPDLYANHGHRPTVRIFLLSLFPRAKNTHISRVMGRTTTLASLETSSKPWRGTNIFPIVDS